MIQDLETGELYGALLYQGGDCVVFWTDGRESMISAERFAELLLTDSDWLPYVGRYLARPDLPDHDHVDVQIRRGELARYAAGNENQILEHRQAEPDPGFWARWLAGMRKGA